jgi:hypothetical protein
MAKAAVAEKTKSTAVATKKKKKESTAVGAPLNWREEMAKYAKKTVAMEENTATGNKISTKGGRLSYHDTPLKNNEMHVLILAGLIEKTKYEGPFDPDSPASPICFAFSEDGEDMEPHEKSHEKQSEKCEDCQWNAWGSSETGKGKACSDKRRLAVMPVSDDVTAEAIEAAEIATLTVPVMSVKGYSAYVKELTQRHGLAVFAYVTRVWLEPDAKSQFRVCFECSNPKPLNEKLYPALLKRVKEAEKLVEQPYIWIEPEEKPKRGAAAKKKPAGKKKF